MKTTGKCPKCGSSEIYTDDKLPKRGDRCTLPVNSWAKIYVNNYVCISCGYFEEYTEKISDKDIEKIKSEWSKV